MSKYLEASYACSTSYQLLARERGVAGRLNSLGVSGGRSEHFFKVEIDGNTVHDGAKGKSHTANKKSQNTNPFCFVKANNEFGNNGLNLYFGFADSLKVSIKDAPKPIASTRYWICYETLHSELVESSFTEEKNVIYEEQLIGHTDEEGEVTETHPRKIRRGKVYEVVTKTPDDVYSRNTEIPIKIILRNWKQEKLEWTDQSNSDWNALRPDLEDLEIRVAPIGRHTPVATYDYEELTWDKNGKYVESRISIAHQGDFRIETNFESCGNIPMCITSV